MAKDGQVKSADLNDGFDAENFAETLVPCPGNGQSPSVVLALNPIQFQYPVQQSGTHCTGDMKAALAPIEARPAEDAF